MAHDNRKYTFTEGYEEIRLEYPIISGLILENSSVLDLGCGNGALMQLLEKKKCTTTGVELSESGVEFCRKKGLNVIQGSIDQPLPFQDNQFDFSVCNVTLQMVLYPEVVLREMKRVSRRMIISFPNFALYKNRLELLLNGRMPRKQLFGYEWYNTGHIHQFSLSDFLTLVNQIGGLRVIGIHHNDTGNMLKNFMIRNFRNMFQIIPIVGLEKTDM
ncbi:MAG: methyltransferase domain-containing protein [Ignavibacteriales bacterium]|nr:methyltransferase domain-containing protein [Ignavibacteriales bacterium]